MKYKIKVENLWAAEGGCFCLSLIVAHVRVTKSYVISLWLENIGKFHNPSS